MTSESGTYWQDGKRQHGAPGSAQNVEHTLDMIGAMARDEEARRLLGVDGVLEGQLDIAFLNDPIDWLAADIAHVISAGSSDEDEDTPADDALTLDILVAEYRLCQILLGTLDETDLIRRVRQHLNGSES